MSATYPSPGALLAEAVDHAGSADFGPGDFREGLEVTLDSLARDGHSSQAGPGGMIADFRLRLGNRLDVERW